MQQLVPCKRGNLFKILRSKKKNLSLVLGKWGDTITCGRKAFASVSEVKDIVTTLQKTSGHVFMEDELKQQLQS